MESKIFKITKPNTKVYYDVDKNWLPEIRISFKRPSLDIAYGNEVKEVGEYKFILIKGRVRLKKLS